MKNLESLNLDEIVAFSLLECMKHITIKHAMKSVVLNCCNNKNILQKNDKLKILRSVLVIIRFCNIHMYICRKNETVYYSNKLNKLLYNLSDKFKEFSSTDAIIKIRRSMAICIVELEKVKLEEDVNKEFIYVKDNMSEAECLEADKKNLKEIDNYFANELPSDKEDIYEFFNI
jgi:hypothetical protein